MGARWRTLGEALRGGGANPLSGRLEGDQLRVGGFERPQSPHQPVVFGVGQARAVQHVADR